jgi:hypothetical protein
MPLLEFLSGVDGAGLESGTMNLCAIAKFAADPVSQGNAQMR